MSVSKLVYLLYTQQTLAPAERKRLLLEVCAPQMLALGLSGLQVNVEDEVAIQTPPSAPRLFGPKPFVAQVNIWLDGAQEALRSGHEAILREAGFVLQGWRADEWLYTEYGENQWEKARYWADGERSPGVLALTIIERPKKIPHDEWMRRWFGWQSPMSEWLQPRSRYARNLLLERVTPDAPAYDGIVEETWPSHEHVVNKKLFFNAGSTLQLVQNMLTMTKSVRRFLRMTHLTNVMASEYFLKTPTHLQAQQKKTV